VASFLFHFSARQLFSEHVTIPAYRGIRLGLERHEPVLSQKAVSKAGF